MKKKCHFIGIGGIGMSGLASIMHRKEAVVTGSDVAANALIECLIKNGVQVKIGHDSTCVTADSTVIYSSGIQADNPEYQAALSMQCHMMHRSDLLLALTHNHKLFGITGTHGKTTTTALMAHVLISAGFDPSYAIGGILKKQQMNAEMGKSEIFVAELDESDRSFMKFSPQFPIITNIGCDHMDQYGTKEVLLQSFKEYIDNLSNPENLLWCGDNMYLKEMSPKGVSFGFCDHCQLRAHNYHQDGWNLCFDISFRGKTYSNVSVPLIGSHNALNALAVFGSALLAGVPPEKIFEAFRSFEGVHRRCEKKGEEQGVLVVDDYAHHPTEISSTLHGIRQAVAERRLIVVYQPHRYSRVKDCLGSFAGIFDEADQVYITEIYGAGEKPLTGISHEDIIEEHEQVSATAIKHVLRKDVVKTLMAELTPLDVVVTLGAGDVTGIGGELIDSLKKKELEN